jgi:hypothetical protein
MRVNVHSLFFQAFFFGLFLGRSGHPVPEALHRMWTLFPQKPSDQSISFFFFSKCDVLSHLRYYQKQELLHNDTLSQS